MSRSRIFALLAATVIVAGGAAASAQGLFTTLLDHHNTTAKPADDPAQDAVLAKAAWQTVATHKSETLGETPPLNAPAYAPVYPDGLILQAAMDTAKPSGGSMEYDAAGPVGAVLDFYKDAAAQTGLPVRQATETPDGAVFVAGDGHRQVSVKLTRQFANGTVVDVNYS